MVFKNWWKKTLCYFERKKTFVEEFKNGRNQCRTQSIFGDTVYLCYGELKLVGAEGTNILDFDNPRSLEKVLSGKELHRKLLLLTKKY